MNTTKTQISRREFKYQIPCWDHLGQSHRRFQNSSPKAQLRVRGALAEPKVQDTEPKTQEADAKMSCGDPSSQKPAFKTQDSTPKNHSISWDGDRQIPEFKTQVPETNDSPWYVLIHNPNPRMSKGADPKLGSESVITLKYYKYNSFTSRTLSLYQSLSLLSVVAGLPPRGGGAPHISTSRGGETCYSRTRRNGGEYRRASLRWAVGEKTGASGGNAHSAVGGITRRASACSAGATPPPQRRRCACGGWARP